ILQASSKDGDLVLDPFCGGGTAIEAAQQLGRRWIGIDVTHLAITLIKNRLETAFGKAGKYQVLGEPTDLAGAVALAKLNKSEFQWWLLSLVSARPAPDQQKKGRDKGIDGRLHFHIEKGGKTEQVIFSVHGGNFEPSDVRDLVGVVN